MKSHSSFKHTMLQQFEKLSPFRNRDASHTFKTETKVSKPDIQLNSQRTESPDKTEGPRKSINHL